MNPFIVPLLAVPVVLGIDWSSVSGGSLAIIGTLILIAGFGLRYTSTGSEARDMLKTMNEELRADNAELRGERESLLEAQEALKEDIHKRELETMEREKVIAELRARPDTTELMRRQDDNHTAAMEIAHQTAETLERVVGMQGDLQAIVAASLNRPQRRTDPGT